MNSNVIRVIAAAFCAGLNVSAAVAQPGKHMEVPPVPGDLEVPAGHVVYLATRAEGTQNYMCAATGPETARWIPVGPRATVFTTLKGDLRQQVMTHYLSFNPDEDMARPTWQHSDDSSRIWARVVRASDDPNYVAPDSIPWLLLDIVGAEPGPTGGSFLAKTTFIQRVNTLGGVPPANDCQVPSQAGVFTMIPYATDYFFYRASRQR